MAIFAKRAQSQEGKLQVELAQLNHLSGRLVRGYGHLQSQKGGIGLKGPGETQLETDRRLIGQKNHGIEKAACRCPQTTRHTPQIAHERPSENLCHCRLYQCRKSSLFNRLTKADVLAKDQLFATLDTTARRLFLSHEASVIFDRYRRLRPRFAA